MVDLVIVRRTFSRSLNAQSPANNVLKLSAFWS